MAKKISKGRPHRRVGSFPERENRERMNPQSIRRLLYDIVVTNFGGDVTVAAEVIEASRKKHKEGRTYRSGITADSLYDLILDRHAIQYFQLEAFAIYLGVPLSLLLFYTRIIADQRERDADKKIEQIVRGFRGIVGDAARKTRTHREFRFADLTRWIEAYTNTDLPPDDPDEPRLL